MYTSPRLAAVLGAEPAHPSFARNDGGRDRRHLKLLRAPDNISSGAVDASDRLPLEQRSQPAFAVLGESLHARQRACGSVVAGLTVRALHQDVAIGRVPSDERSYSTVTRALDLRADSDLS